jgi:hypothetical protein
MRPERLTERASKTCRSQETSANVGTSTRAQKKDSGMMAVEYARLTLACSAFLPLSLLFFGIRCWTGPQNLVKYDADAL